MGNTSRQGSRRRSAAVAAGTLVLVCTVALTALAAPAGVLFLAVVAVSALPLRD